MSKVKNGTLNVKNRTIFCHDNLEILQGINSLCIDLIYLDPPFNKNKVFSAPIGSTAEGASFRDIFREEDLKDEWLKTIEKDHVELYNFLNGVKNIRSTKHYLYNYCYLAYMAIRLIECYRVLKDTGSIYYHCDQTMSHYIKLLMDIIFGERNFKNEIIWCYKGASEAEFYFPRKHDTILFYAKSDNTPFNFDAVRVPYKDGNNKPAKWADGEHGKNPLGTKCLDWWDSIPSFMTASQSKERTGYRTQKPLRLLKRIIEASSNTGNVVLDPFCGCATSSIAAEILDRKWVGIDISYKAFELVQERLKKEIYQRLDADRIQEHEPNLKVDPPKRTDLGEDYVEKGYVYIISNPAYPGYFKVGVTNDVKRRLNNYQTSDPERRYRLEYSVLTPYFRELEKHIIAHDKFIANGEWVIPNNSWEEIRAEIEHFLAHQ